MTTQTAAHTPGRLIIRKGTELVTDAPYFEQEFVGFSANGSEENAARLMDCWNALEGMNPDAIADVVAAAGSLFDAIAHGDEEHRSWLKKAIDDHFAGRPVERPRGKGSREIEDLDEAEIEDAWEFWWSEFYDAAEKEQTDSFDIGDLQLAYSRAYQAGHASAIALARLEVQS